MREGDNWDLYGPKAEKPPPMREFDTGATRDTDDGKLDYEGALSPLVWQRFAQYMERNSHLPDGSQRASDNWQKGMPQEAYIKSGFRHVMDWWLLHRELPARDGVDLEEALCGVLFNVQGYLHELLRSRLTANPPAQGV